MPKHSVIPSKLKAIKTQRKYENIEDYILRCDGIDDEVDVLNELLPQLGSHDDEIET